MISPGSSLKNKVALVTGASRGIGKAIALTFAEASADVAVAARRLPELEKVAGEIEAQGRRSLAVQTDTGVKSEVDNMVMKTVEALGSIDILVNVPALYMRHRLVDSSEAEWDSVMNTSLKGYYLCSQAAGRTMAEKKKGVIINISSINAKKADSHAGAHCIAKAGVSMLTKVLALEMAPHNIRVNAIGPGMVRTELSEQLISEPESLARYVALYPLGRIAETKDIVGAALFLASDASSYVTGQTIYVDGGRLIAG